MEYLYKNLSPDDFEDLAQDVISKRFGLSFEKFKPGKDGGIDLRLIREGSNVVAQVKHMIGSFGAGHRSAFKKEYSKAKKIAEITSSARYIIITSCNLSKSNKNEISDMFSGLIKNDSDIIGIEDIEQTLRESEDIVRRHFKLWISSSKVLFNILNNKVFGKSEDYFKHIVENKTRLFVKTKTIDSALEILQNHRVLVVTGDPGIGKTTLSEMLCLHYSGRDYQFVYCDDIDEAETVFTKDARQIFLLDDFLGSNFLEIFSGKEESKILRFIDRIKVNPSKALILNSRTAIYQQAGNKGIHWGNHHWPALKYSIDLGAYDEVDRARMLYNHLRFRGIGDEYFETIKVKKAYLKIVTHTNFSPRTIEAITSKDRLASISANKYIQHISESLDNPIEIWKTSYKSQINDEQRWLLQTLFTFKGECEENTLRMAFATRLKYERFEHGHKISENSFNDACSELLDAMIFRSIERKNNDDIVRWKFINPSIFDYLHIYTLESPEIIKSMINSMHHIQQWDTLLALDRLRPILISKGYVERLFDETVRYECAQNRNHELEILNLEIAYKLEMPNEKFMQIALNGFAMQPESIDIVLAYKIIHELRIRGLSERFNQNQSEIYEFCVGLFCQANDIDDIENLVNEFDVSIANWNIEDENHQNPPIKESVSDWRVLRRINTLVYNESERLISEDHSIPEILDVSDMAQRIQELETDLKYRLKSFLPESYDIPQNAFDFDYEGQTQENRINSQKDDDEYEPGFESITHMSQLERIEHVFKE